VEDDIEQLFPGFRALILAEIGKWRSYDPKMNPGILDSFSSAVMGHRNRYRAKLEQLKYANADSKKQLDMIEKDIIRLSNRVIADAIARGKIEYVDNEKPASEFGQKVWAAYRALGNRRHFNTTHMRRRRRG
jgi:hypothetical protein